MQVYSSLGLMTVEDLGEGRTRLTIKNHGAITRFVDWFNKHLFAKPADQTAQTITEREMPIAKALVFYGKKIPKGDNGLVKLNLLDVQNNSMKDLGVVCMATDVDTLAEKKLTQDRQSGEGGVSFVAFDPETLENLLQSWEIIYALRKVQASF
jgi:hypothetical protein